MLNQNIISNKFDLNLATTLSSYMDKHSSLFGPFLSEKFFVNTALRASSIKRFTFVIDTTVL
jgi:hypothetical protein